ncbi:MAG: hypothetical protein ACD_48C00253G0002, partial [uncultured bacterium]
ATGDLAAPGKTDAVEMQDHSILKDSLSVYCLDCPHPDNKPVFIRP